MPLVLSRNVDETIVIGEGDDAVVITFLGNKGRQCKLGIKANKKIPVNRGEVYEAKVSRGELQPLVSDFVPPDENVAHIEKDVIVEAQEPDKSVDAGIRSTADPSL